MATAKVLATSENYRMLAINKDNAHYAMAQRYNTRHTALGVAAIVTSAIVSTVIFSTVAESPQIGWRVATGIISATAAMLAALQTFLKLSEQAERHITSAAGYSRLRRQLELFQLRYGHGGSTDDALDALAALGAELDSLETSSPPITETIYDEMRDRFAHERNDWT